MANIVEINSIYAEGAEVFSSLTEAQLKSKRDPRAGLFIAESPNVIAAALDAGYEPVSFLMGHKQMEGCGRELIERCGEIPVYTGPDELLEQLAGYRLTRGILCAMRRRELPDCYDVLMNSRRAAVLWDIVDPTNVGAIFRSAAALGADAVLVSASCCDPLHRRAARVSTGSVFKVPWARLPAGGAEEGLTPLAECGFVTAALALDESALSVTSPLLRKAEKLALVLGTEGHGLPDEVTQKCSCKVYIPMTNGVDSLNVGAAAAVAFWQVFGAPEDEVQ